MAYDIKHFLKRVPLELWVFLATFLFQFAVINSLANSAHFIPIGDDMQFYNNWAQRILSGTLTEEERTKAFYGLPGYAYILAGIYKITGGYSYEYSEFLIGQVQALLHALTATFLYLIARRVFSNSDSTNINRANWIGVSAALFWSLCTPAQIFSSILMPTSWLICSFWGLVWWILRTDKDAKTTWWNPWFFQGLLIGITAMAIATIFMLIPLVLICLLRYAWRANSVNSRISRLAVSCALLFVGVFLGCSPVWIHNRFVAKDKVFLTAHDGLNFYLGNHSGANGYTHIPDGIRASQDGLLRDSLTIPEQVLQRPLMRSEVSRYWKQKGIDYIAGNFPAWLRLLYIKFENFWNAFQYDDVCIIKLMKDEGVLPPGLTFGFIAAIGLPGIFVCALRFRLSLWVSSAVMLHMLSLMPVFITERYRMAALPGLCILGAGGLWLLWEKTAARKWWSASMQIALTIFCAWFVSKPKTDISLWSLEQYTAGIKAISAAESALEANNPQEGEYLLQQAQRNLEAAYAYVPNGPEIHFAIGNIFMIRKNHEKAEELYKMTVMLAMGSNRLHDGALNNLGVISMLQKKWTEAESYFMASLKAESRSPKTWYLLAQAAFEAGHFDTAKRAIAEALKRSPSQSTFIQLQEKLKNH